MKSIDTILRILTFDELYDWAGEKILNRAKGYVKHVDSLSRTEDNTLVAWVTGSKRYATSVRVHKGDEIEFFCTCPYSWGPCKHAVAVILAAAEQVKNEKAIPVLEEDELHQTLFGGSEEEKWIDDEWDGEPAHAPVTQRKKTLAKVVKILSDKNRDDLLHLLIDLSGRFPEVTQHIVEIEQLASGQVDSLVHSLLSEIRDLTAEPAWYNPWSGEGSLPDFSHVEEQLRTLASRDHSDEVLQLGAELWTRGNAQIEQSDDEGETAMAIASCLEIVLSALRQSSLPPSQQLLWVIDRVLDDEYSLLESAEIFLTQRAYNRTHWREVATTLDTRLQAMPKPRNPGFANRYRRKRLLVQLMNAYGRAGWNDRIIPRLEDEADVCQCYPLLIDALLAAGEKERARQWCIQGYARTMDGAPGIASILQEHLRKMAQKERRYDMVAAFRAQDFFDRPSSTAFNELHKAAEKALSWPAVRDAILCYLETGQHPASSDQMRDKSAWPLPSPEVEPPLIKRRTGQQGFPDLETLIDIAIVEKRFDDVVALYQRLGRTKRWGWETDKTVAEAVANTHPDLALSIWQDVVESLIAQVKPKAYEKAAVYLRFMKKVYTRHHRMEDWRGLLEGLRRKHKAKRRLIEVLDTLSKKKLVD